MNKPATTSTPPHLKSEPHLGHRPIHVPVWVYYLLALGIVVAVTLVAGRHIRVSKELKESQDAATQTTVEVMSFQPDSSPHDLILPGNIQAFQDATLFARTNGYIKAWHKDIGAQVKAGDLIAEIEAPDLDAQLRQAQANLDIASLNFEREKDLLTKKVVSQQDYDTARTSFEAQKAAVQNLQAQQGFEKIIAPFDGTVTKRNIDVGDLVSAGSTTAGTLLFEIQQSDPLRIYVNVPQTNAPDIHTGMKAKILVNEYPGRDFEGTVARTAGAIDPASRTLLTEVDIPNPDGTLYAGMYAQVKFVLEEKAPPIVVPANVFRFRAGGPQVAIIKDGNKIHWQDVKVGRDFGTKIELVSGIDEQMQVVNNPTDDLVEGLAVQVKQAQVKPPAGADNQAPSVPSSAAKPAAKDSADGQK
ncbi:MAG TPA: efflux RND transporter periplasmic adaptor subunit [Chthoniobacteraceae bacterium]|nr:efflux RND transporter periplasmic adaptor subunit [Chthoniobacteraceae bacterium]